MGIVFEEIDYINVYGISMYYNDKYEIMVIKIVFGEYVYKFVVSFIKLMIGYFLGVVGGIEVIFFVFVIKEGVILLIINI